jgi:hypothetical protein
MLTARRNRPVQDWRKAPLFAWRCFRKRSSVLGVVLKSPQRWLGSALASRQSVLQYTRLSLVLSMEPRVSADLCKDEQQRGHRSSYLHPSAATLAQAAWFL